MNAGLRAEGAVSPSASVVQCSPSPETSSAPASASAPFSTSAARGVTVTLGGAAGAASGPSRVASSPEAWSWRTMSEPPRNSPLTYSCGIVGQSEKALMPSRIAGSASTLTVV